MSGLPESSFPRADPGRAALALVVGLVLFTASWALLHVGFFAGFQIVDTPVYEQYGERILAGDVPYRDFAVEYPPAALPLFALPALAGEGDYGAAFGALMWACGAAALVFVVAGLRALEASSTRLFAAAAFLGLAPLALGSVVLTRYDFWPAALVAAALAAFLSGRARAGFAVIALAAAAKVYPLVLLPLAAAWVSRRDGRREAAVGLAVFIAALAVVVLPFAVLAPGGLVDSLGRQLGRPLQIESLGAAVLLALEQVGAYSATVVSSHGSQNLAGQVPAALAAIQTALQALAVLVVWLVFASRASARDELAIASAAAVAAFVAFGKVLSPQFLVWLVPLVPLVVGGTGLAAAALLGLALVLTQAWFPDRYWNVVALEPVGLLVLVRDLVLVALFAVLLVAVVRRESERPRSW
jgi:hypothetical protein